MQFGKIKTEICRDWKEVGQAALTCYTMLLCCRYDKDGSCYTFDESGGRDNFKWSYVAEMLGVTAPHVSNWKKTLCKKGWICEIDGRIYPVKGFETELTKLGIEFWKHIPEEAKSSNDLNSAEATSNDLNLTEDSSNHLNSENKSSSHLNFSKETSNHLNFETSNGLNSPGKSSNDLNFSDQTMISGEVKSSNGLNSSSNDLNFSSRVIRNTEITEKFNKTVVVGGITTTRAREPTDRPPPSVNGDSKSNSKSTWQWEELTPEEERMSVIRFVEHLKREFPRKNVDLAVKNCRQFCRENPKVKFVKQRIKGWVFNQFDEINDPEFLKMIDEQIEEGKIENETNRQPVHFHDKRTAQAINERNFVQAARENAERRRREARELQGGDASGS
jgi:hypothetical protein